jgi:hypothetical protein
MIRDVSSNREQVENESRRAAGSGPACRETNYKDSETESQRLLLLRLENDVQRTPLRAPGLWLAR